MNKIPTGYGAIQRKAMQKNISMQSKSLYALLCSYTGNSEFCWPSQELLADDLKTTIRTISRLLKELEDSGLIKRIKMFKDSRKNVKYEVYFAD